jgi:fluoroquinolone transport system permease protein
VPITFYFIAGVFLCSCLFSAVGLIIAAKSISLNGFILSTIPAQLLINIPAVAYLFGWKPRWLLLHPGVCLLELCKNGPYAGPALVILLFWTLLAGAMANREVGVMFKSLGGIKL